MGGIFHAYNRGLDKREVFHNDDYYERFILSMREFNNTLPTGSLYIQSRRSTSTDVDVERLLGDKLVDIIAFSLLPNHYHILMREVIDGGMAEFMKRLVGGNTKYYNAQNNRSGPIFQGKYKRKLVDDDDYLLYLTAYINGNIEIHKMGTTTNWPWSSYNNFINNENSDLAESSIIKGYFSDESEYVEYVKDVIKNAKENKDERRKYLLE